MIVLFPFYFGPLRPDSATGVFCLAPQEACHG
jgi:hypothetical protein